MTNNFQNQFSWLNLNQENFNDHRNRNTTPKKTNNCGLKELNLKIILDRKFSPFDSPIVVKVFTCIRRFFSWKISMTSSGGKKKERERENDSRRKSDMSDDAWDGSAVVVPRGFSRQKEGRGTIGRTCWHRETSSWSEISKRAKRVSNDTHETTPNDPRFLTSFPLLLVWGTPPGNKKSIRGVDRMQNRRTIVFL